jgi:CRISPR-associated protein Cmr5
MDNQTRSEQRTIDQKRAQQAWLDIRQIKGKGFEKEFRSLALSAPADIQISGLGQVLAFLRAKGKNEHNELYGYIQGWLRGQSNITGDLLEWISQTATTEEYRRATAEAMAFLMWLKRFAEAELKKV